MIDPAAVCLFIPHGLKGFKQNLFDRIGSKIEAAGGSVVRGDHSAVDRLPDDVIPIVGCTPPFRTMIAKWKERGRNWIYWDRGYIRRVFATWLPNGHDLGIPGGFYRWHLNSFQSQVIRDVPDDRWQALHLHKVGKGVTVPFPWPWHKGGSHIVVADTGFDYWDLHADREWTKRTADELRKYTDRKIVIRDKESKVPLYDELKDAHALVTHGSIAAVESVVMGCPVFVHPVSAAALMGLTDFSKIEAPIYPERERWLYALAWHQWNETELCDGTLWRQIT